MTTTDPPATTPTPTPPSAPSATSATSATATAPRKRNPRRRERSRGLPAWRRLRATRDFARVERQGIRAQGQFVAVTVRPGPGRLGLVVSKKLDNRAVERNLVKRRLREIFRAEKPRWAQRAHQPGSAPGASAPIASAHGPVGSVDVVVTARPEAKGKSFAALQQDALATLEQALVKLAQTPKPSARPSSRPSSSQHHRR